VALRLGFRQIKGFPETPARAIVTARGAGYATPHDVWRRAGLDAPLLDKLVQADVFSGLGLERRGALWAVKALKAQPLPLFEAAERREVGLSGPDLLVEPETSFRDLAPGEALTEDYAALRLSLRAHPLALLRGALIRAGAQPCRKLETLADGARVTVAGLVVCRQRPGSASGVVFITLEDEEAIANLVVWAKVFEEHRRAIMGGRLLMVTGRVQKDGLTIHLVAEALSDLTGLLAALSPEDHPHGTVARVMETARADRVRHNRPVVLGRPSG
jgi:error-prone DNA polymerase